MANMKKKIQSIKYFNIRITACYIVPVRLLPLLICFYPSKLKLGAIISKHHDKHELNL